MMKKSRSQAHGDSSAAAAAVPAVGSYSASAGFFVAIAGLLYLAQAEGCYNHGLFSPAVYEPYADLRSIPKLGGPSPIDAGRDVYMAAGCVACHQPNGSGNPANGCPPLAKSDWVLAEGPARLIRIVLHGAQGPITVNGQPWNGNMTPFGGSLSDEQIAHVLTFVRQSPEWGNNASEVTAEMVKAVREKESSRAAQWTASELEQIPVMP